ncbi:MAG: hypothetical protein HY537_17920 [Deltaproteobacteria bacterium]|nr:hypothetical protein [Deltaproteobacteria bacterium]
MKESSGALRLVPKSARAFNQGGRVIIVSPDSNGFAAFSHSTREARTFLRKLSSGMNAVGIAIDLGVAGSNIYQDWGTPKQGSTTVREATKTVITTGAGFLGTGIASKLCAVLTFTSGWGGVACYLSVLVGYGAGLAWVSEKTGEGFANFFYRSAEPKVIEGAGP